MILALQLWLVYHAALALLGLAERAPVAWWQRFGAMPLRMWLYRRAYVFADKQDGWLGGFWDTDRRRLYVLLCPWFGLRLDVSRTSPAYSRLYALLMGEIRAEKQIKALSNAHLGRALTVEVWSKFALGTRPSLLVGEAIDRLVMLPNATSEVVNDAAKD